MAQASQVQALSPDFLEVSRMVPSMDMQQLNQLRNTPYGFLASIELSKRNRMMLQKAAGETRSKPGETLFDEQLRALRQRQLQEALANDERVGLNNIIAQAEQGGIEFGQPTEEEPTEMAGGGMVAFDQGGKVNQAGEKYEDVPNVGRFYEDGSVGFALPLGALIGSAVSGARALGPLAMRGLSGLRGLATKYPKTTAATALTTPLGFMDFGGPEGPTEEDRKLQKQYEAQDIQEGYESKYRADRGEKGEKGGADAAGAAGRSGITGLDLETDPRKLIKLRQDLEKEMGLGEFGAKAKEIKEKRKGRVEETIGRALESEPFLAAAEAAGGGGKRMSGLQALAAAVGAGGKSAAGIQRQKTEALDKLAEGEERLALAEEQYLRGNVGDAVKESRQGKKELFDANMKLRELGLKETYYNALGLAAKAKAAGGGGFKLGDVTKASQAIAEMNSQMKMLDPKKDAAQIAQLQQLIRVLQGGIGMAYARGSGATIEDVE